MLSFRFSKVDVNDAWVQDQSIGRAHNIMYYDHDNMSHGTWKLAENSYGCEVGTYMYLFAKCLIPATQLGGH